MKPFYIVGNWKSHKTVAEAVMWYQDITILWKKRKINARDVKIIICPSVLHLTTLASMIALSPLPIELGVQDISAYPQGAYTGQISADMVRPQARFTLIGHSERRKYNHEEDNELAEKAAQAVAHGIEPIYCIQDPKQAIAPRCKIVGYEPVWAIGTGKPETAANADIVAAEIKKRHGSDTIVIYGGSVTAENVASYKQASHIGGVLPGGASLEPATFLDLIANA
jgi:triosephosphate isomerase